MDPRQWEMEEVLLESRQRLQREEEVRHFDLPIRQSRETSLPTTSSVTEDTSFEPRQRDRRWQAEGLRREFQRERPQPRPADGFRPAEGFRQAEGPQREPQLHRSRPPQVDQGRRRAPRDTSISTRPGGQRRPSEVRQEPRDRSRPPPVRPPPVEPPRQRRPSEAPRPQPQPQPPRQEPRDRIRPLPVEPPRDRRPPPVEPSRDRRPPPAEPPRNRNRPSPPEPPRNRNRPSPPEPPRQRRPSEAPRPQPQPPQPKQREKSRPPPAEEPPRRRRLSDLFRPSQKPNPTVRRQPSRRIIHTKVVDERFEVETEKIKRYRDGGNYPVHINDTIGPKNQYRVLNKLGAGSFGVVWLVEDTLDPKARWKALKINDAAEEDNELRIQEVFKNYGITGHKALEAQVCVPYELFSLDGPNGTNLCSILPILGAPLDEAVKNDNKLSRRAICRNVIKALHFLHSEVKIFHADFRPANILVQIPGLQELDESEILQVYGGDPRVITSDRLVQRAKISAHRAPRYLVCNAKLDTKLLAKFVKKKTGKALSINKPKVAVTDFGSAKHVSYDKPWEQTIARNVKDPWTEAGGGAGFYSDIFSMGITIFQVMTGRHPFIRGGNYGTTFGGYFAGIEVGLGRPMPLELREMCWNAGIVHEMYNGPPPPGFKLEMDPEKPVTKSVKEHRAFEDRYIGKLKEKGAMTIPHGLLMLDPNISRDEANIFWELIYWCCAWLPTERPRVYEVVEHPWYLIWSRRD